MSVLPLGRLAFPDVTRQCGRIMATAAIAAVANAFLLAYGNASTVPWTTDKPVRVTVKDQSLPELLRAIVMENRIPVVISDAVRGNVSGSFNQPLDRLMDELSGSLGFTWFYDGYVIYVDSLSESTTRMVPLSSDRFSRMREIMDQLGIDGKRYPIRWLDAENSIVASGPPRFLQTIEELAQVIEHVGDRPNSPLDVRVFRLKHAWAKDIPTGESRDKKEVIPGVATLLRQIMVGNRPPTGLDIEDVLARDLPFRPTSLHAPDPAKSMLPVLPLFSSNGKPNAKGGEAEQSKPKSTLVSNLRPGPEIGKSKPLTPSIEADPRINAVVVRDTRDRMALYEGLIKDLDVPAELVEIEATVIDLDMDSSSRTGLSWRIFSNSNADVALGGALPALAQDAGKNLENGATQYSAANVGALGSGANILSSVVLGSARNYFAATIDALARNGHARIVTSPRVLTLDNIEAVLENQNAFHVRVAGQYDANLFQVSAGLTLKVTPRIERTGEKTKVKLLVMVEDGTFAPAQVDQIPVVSRKNINTQAVIDAGDSLLIGGYVVDEALTDKNKVPVLGELPVLGALFRNDKERNRRVERMLLITPRILAP